MFSGVFELLQEPVRHQIERQGIVEASEIQRLSIPHILRGENVLLIAPTGTGKTLAAMLPIFDLYISIRKASKPAGIAILYITPLRALNRDLLRRLMESGRDLGLDVQVRHGDTPTSVRMRQAKNPPDMLITTPETLQAILPGRKMKEHLRNVRWVVIDEIHELAGDKRGVQLSLALERLSRIAKHRFQRIGLSATIGEPEKVADFLSGSGNKAVIVRSTELKDLDVKIEYVNPSKKDCEEAERLGIPASAVSRIKRICELISSSRSTLIFTNTREHAEALGSQVYALGYGNLVKIHHGSLSREIREEVESEFQTGKLKSVICTSSLELGIDIGTVDLVLQYTSPREATRLIQRVGRSGHQIKCLPKGYVIATWADDILESAILLKHVREGRLERVKIHEKALDVLAHQIVGLILDSGRITLGEAYETVKGAYPYRDIAPETFHDVVKQLHQQRILNLRGETLTAKYPNTHRYYYENLSVIPDVKKYTVFDFNMKRRLGTLDQDFVARRCRTGAEFIMHGNTWRVISLDDENLSVEVEAATPTLNAIPSWEGEIIPVDYYVAVEVGGLREAFLKTESSRGDLTELSNLLHIDNSAAAKVLEAIEKHTRDYPLPTDKRIVVEQFENCIIIHSCFGNLVNETFGLILAAMLQAKYGTSILTQVDAYRIALITPTKLHPKTVSDILLNLKPGDVANIVEGAIENTEMFAWRHWHVAKRFGAVEAKADYTMRRARLLVEAYRETPINFETKREILLEKMDVEKTSEVISKVSTGEIKIEAVQQKGIDCSPLALPIVDKIVPHNLLRPAIPSQPLAEIVKERLMSTNIKLVCVFNGDWEGVRAVKTLPDTIKCPKCGSTLIAVTYHGDQELLSIIVKKRAKKRLDAEEEEQWNRAWRSASLVQTAGKRAVLTLAARGVGPATAARILRRYVRSEAEFYAEILKAEREYQRTRLFWD
ncbi:DEAD/DEAH box helicase [Candidatus Bathyarchaeota archaeon]|nr:DEAD/DEAH box helicase [Candidatus Bathyarchaeota archaeon]